MEFIADGEERRFADAFGSVADEYGWTEMAAIRREVRERQLERHSSSFIKRLSAENLLGIHWPEPYGREATAIEALLMRERVETDGFPGYGVVSDEAAAAFIINFGTPQQRDHHLPRILSGEWHYARALSEPDAGSDLLALRTSAVRDGDSYVVNGSKLWISQAHIADWFHALVRTDPSQQRQRGLSLLLIATGSPGIEIRPVKVMGGWQVNEVFFTDVHVPCTNLLGQEDEGWRVITWGLDAERAFSFGGNETRLFASRLIHRLSSGVSGVSDSDLERLGHFITELEVDRLLYLQVALRAQRKESTTAVAPMSKISGSELAQTFVQWAADVVGHATLFPVGAGEPSDDQLAADLEEQLRVATVLTVIGGTSEVQRNTIARHALGLSKGS